MLTMKYFFKQSLEDMAAIKVVVTLWDQDDIRTLIKAYSQILHRKEMKFRSCFKKNDEWNQIENCVINKVQKLPQPNILKEKMLGFIKPIGLQILKWIEYNFTHYLRVDPMSELHWTSQGTVDRKHTAEILVKNENLDIYTRYVLACIYCFEDVIIELRNKLTKNCLQSVGGIHYTKGFFSQHKMVFLWTYKMNDRRIDTSYKSALQHAVESHNLVAIEHFLEKMSPREIEESVVYSVGLLTSGRCISYSADFPDEGYADVVCYLYLQMKEDQVKEAFKNYHFQALICFLEWPWQYFFLEAASHMQDALVQDDYFCLLMEMIHKEKDGCNVLYQKLFGEFWQRIPNSFKRNFVEFRTVVILLSNLFEIKDLRNIKLIFQDLTLAEKQEHIFIPIAIHICKKFKYDDDLDLLKFIIQECQPSKDVVMKFKEDFKKHTLLDDCSSEKLPKCLEKDKHLLDRVFSLLDDFVCECDERINVEHDDRDRK